MNTVRKSETNKLKRTHLYYKYTGFYSFVGHSLKKSILPILAVVGVLVLLNAYVIDFGEFFTYVTEKYAPLNILIVFLASESLLGLVPPEIFIAWSHKMPQPILYLTLLAVLCRRNNFLLYRKMDIYHSKSLCLFGRKYEKTLKAHP